MVDRLGKIQLGANEVPVIPADKDYAAGMHVIVTNQGRAVSMRLTNIIATAHPAGNRIDLAWKYPPKDGLPGVRVVRREGSHPENPDDGVEITTVEEGSGVRFAHDRDLKGETVYYYTLFPVRGTPPKLRARHP